MRVRNRETYVQKCKNIRFLSISVICWRTNRRAESRYNEFRNRRRRQFIRVILTDEELRLLRKNGRKSGQRQRKRCGSYLADRWKLLQKKWKWKGCGGELELSWRDCEVWRCGAAQHCFDHWSRCQLRSIEADHWAVYTHGQHLYLWWRCLQSSGPWILT